MYAKWVRIISSQCFIFPGQWLTDAKDCITGLYDSKWTHSRNWFENIGSFHLNLFAKLAVYGPSQLSWTLKADGWSHSSWYWLFRLFSSILWHLVDHFSKLLKELRLNLARAYQTWIVRELNRARNDFISQKHRFQCVCQPSLKFRADFVILWKCFLQNWVSL